MRGGDAGRGRAGVRAPSAGGDARGRRGEGPPGGRRGRGGAAPPTRRVPSRTERAARPWPAPARGAAGGAGRGLTCRPSPSGTVRPSSPAPRRLWYGPARRKRGKRTPRSPGPARATAAGAPPSGRGPPSRHGRRAAISGGRFSHPSPVLPPHRTRPLTFPATHGRRVRAGLTCTGVVPASRGWGQRGAPPGGRGDAPGRGAGGRGTPEREMAPHTGGGGGVIAFPF